MGQSHPIKTHLFQPHIKDGYFIIDIEKYITNDESYHYLLFIMETIGREIDGCATEHSFTDKNTFEWKGNTHDILLKIEEQWVCQVGFENGTHLEETKQKLLEDHYSAVAEACMFT